MAKKYVLLLTLYLLVFLTACEVAAPTPAIPLPSAPPSPAGTIAPTATLEPYLAFARNLQIAIEKGDENALKALFAPVWINARYRSEGTQYRTADDALAAFRAIRQNAKIIIDLNRAVVEPTWATKFGERVIIARWQLSDGRTEFAHLYANRVNYEWRWAALLTGVPYYASPTISMIRLDPARYAGREVQIIGEYRGANNDKALKDAPPSGSTTFTIKDASDALIWVTASFLPGQEPPLKPNDANSIGKMVRVIGSVQNSAGRPYIATDSTVIVAPESFVTQTGHIKILNLSTGLITLDNEAQVALSPTTSIAYYDTRVADVDALSAGARILATGRPTTNNTLFAEHIFLLPAATPTAAPAITRAPTLVPSPTLRPTTPPPATTTPLATPRPTAPPPALGALGSLMYTREGKIFLRNLDTQTEYLLSEGGNDFDWHADGTRALFEKNGEIWVINRDGSGAQKIGSGTKPQWQPAGALILFERNVQRDNTNHFKLRGEVWTMNADGSNARKLAEGFDPTWDPEGKRIAFAANPSTINGKAGEWLSYSNNSIRLTNAQGQNTWAPLRTDSASPKLTALEWQLSQSRLLDTPQWSPDGRELTVRVSNGHGTYVTTDARTGGFGKLVTLFFDGLARGFSYSPDSGYIIFSSGGLSDWESFSVYRRSAILRDGVSGSPIRTIGKQPRQPTDTGQTVTAYAWSPDGAWLAYHYFTYPGNDQTKQGVSAGLWIIEIASGKTQQIVTNGAGPLVWIR